VENLFRPDLQTVIAVVADILRIKKRDTTLNIGDSYRVQNNDYVDDTEYFESFKRAGREHSKQTKPHTCLNTFYN